MIIYKGLICDLDGTLIDSEPLQAKAWTKTMNDAGRKVDENWFSKWCGSDDKTTAVILSQEYPILGSWQNLVEMKNNNFRELLVDPECDIKIAAYDGTKDALEKLKNTKIPLTIATNNNQIDASASLSITELIEYFPVINSIESVEKGKPEPDIFISAAKSIDLYPAECVAIEDSSAGVRAAKKAGCYVIAVLNTHQEELLKDADQIFPSTKEAFQWILDYFVA